MTFAMARTRLVWGVAEDLSRDPLKKLREFHRQGTRKWGARCGVGCQNLQKAGSQPTTPGLTCWRGCGWGRG